MARLICAQCLYEGRDQRNEQLFREIAVVDGDSMCKGHAQRALKKRRADDIYAAKTQPIHDPRFTTPEGLSSDEDCDDTSETDEHVPLDSSHSSPQSDFYAQPGLSNQPGWGYGQRA